VNNTDPVFRQVAEILTRCQHILFITGAGLSADSGLPTYRGVGGLYQGSLTPDGISVEEALSGDTFRKSPAVTWKYLAEIEKNCRRAFPNRGHQIIAEMERYFKRVLVLTQNIDGFHTTAGSTRVIEIHGNLRRLFCARCDRRLEVRDFSLIQIPPVCEACGGVVRPDVVLFGEMLSPDTLKLFYDECRQGFDCCFTVGTSSLFAYVQEPVFLLKSQHRPTIEINPAETEISDVTDIKIRDGAARALGLILDEYLKIL
jgi:NAD-dependent deacetylase